MLEDYTKLDKDIAEWLIKTEIRRKRDFITSKILTEKLKSVVGSVRKRKV